MLASTLESLDSHISVTVEVEPSDLAARANNLAVVLASLNTFYEDRYVWLIIIGKSTLANLMFSSLGQLVMLSPASPRTLAMIPPSNKALNQMVSLQLCYLQSLYLQRSFWSEVNLSLCTGRSLASTSGGCCPVRTKAGRYQIANILNCPSHIGQNHRT